MLECDLIMKGGITSGVVYPKAIVEIARKYRLRCIGGTSAGAIGAVFAAAAEYRRQTAEPGDDPKAGFTQIEQVAKELGSDMESLFQPSPALAPLFGILMAMVGRKKGQSTLAAVLPAVLSGYGMRLALGGAFGAFLFLGGVAQGDVALILLGIVLAVAGGIAFLAASIFASLWRGLPEHDFGICPGKTMPGHSKPGFTDWIADNIDIIAGNLGPDGKPGRPLTCGDLKKKGIEVAAMTTDLSSRRPYRLPMKNKLHFFSKAEFERLFPKRIVDFLTDGKEPLSEIEEGEPCDLYPLSIDDDFPVLLVARMSLSFPGLISAVPLYRTDYQLSSDLHPKGLKGRCLFSDGGISSNFPIHFFDAFLPSRPTFGIMLGSWEETRHGDKRINLPSKRRQSTDLPVKPVDSIPGFAMSIVDTAKDWQDTLQSLLPGYAERIVEVRLDDSKEGGMNLSMDADTIDTLVGYGEQAGLTLTDPEQFKFDEHRWRRALTVLPELETVLEKFARTYRAAPAGAEPDALSYAQVLTDYSPDAYGGLSQSWRKDVLAAFADSVAKMGNGRDEDGQEDGAPSATRINDEKSLPVIDGSIRLVADADRVPAKKEGGG